MSKLTKILIFLVLGTGLLSSCSTEKVNPDQIGVAVITPYIFGSDQTEVLEPGRHYFAWSSSIVIFNKTPRRFKETFQDLTTKDKSNVDFDIYFKIQILEDQVNDLYSKYGGKWYTNNLSSELRRIARVICMDYDMEPLTSDSKISREIENKVTLECEKLIKELGLPVKLISVNMGGINPPNEVLNERSRTAAQKQKEKTLVQAGINEDQRKKNEAKRALADKAYRTELGLTTDQFIELKRLDIQEQAYKKAHTVILNGSAQPTMNIR